MADVDRQRDGLSMADVARLAGTSKSTVSRVLSNTGQIGEALRERVLKVVRETSYVPDLTASRLGRQRAGGAPLRHRTLAVVFGIGEGGFSPFWNETYAAILETAHTEKLAVTTCLVHRHEIETQVPPEAFSRTQFDGILLLPLPGLDYSVVKQYAPVVMFGGSPRAGDVPLIQPDNRTGVHALMTHLVELGHRRIEFVPHDLDRHPFRERRDAFTEFAERMDIEGTVARPVHDNESDYATSFCRRPADERPTAVLASEDQTAGRLARAFRDAGLDVPSDVSVAGFDGRFSEKSSLLSLTTWRVDWRGLGELAVRTLLDLIEGKSVGARTLVGGELLARESTAATAQMAGATMASESIS